MRRMCGVVLVGALMTLLGCGEDDSPEPPSQPALPDYSESFVGTWTYVSGSSVTTTCSGVTRTDPRTGTLTLRRLDANRIEVVDGSCPTRFTATATGKGALGDADQECTGLPIESATLHLDASLLRQVVRMQGVANSNGCTFTEVHGSLTKQP